MLNSDTKVKRKILILSYQYPPSIGGAGVVARDTARLLSQEHTVTLVTLDKGHSITETFYVEQAKTTRPFRFIGFWRKLKTMDLTQFDDIIANDTGASLVAALYFPAHLKAKCWVYLHGSEPENIFIKPELMLRALRFKHKYIDLLEQSKHIIAVSGYMKDKFIDTTGLVQLTKKISIVTNGIDEQLFRPSEVDLRVEYGLKPDYKILLSVSRLTAKKGYSRKLKLFKQLRDKYNVFWIIIGNGQFAQDLQSMITKLGLQNDIVIIQDMQREQLAKYYSGVDLFWLLSEYDESFGLVYLEANFCGCPVIGNKKGGIPYVISDGENGYLVPQSDDSIALQKIEKALITPTLPSQHIIHFVSQYKLENVQAILREKLNSTS